MQTLASMLIIEDVVLTERMYLLRKRGRTGQYLSIITLCVI